MTSQYSDSPVGDFVTTFQFDAEIKKARQWPFFMGIVFLAASMALIFLERTAEDTTLLSVALAGYFLTPLATALMLILAMRAHKNSSSLDGYQEQSGLRVIKMCSFVAWAGFVVAIPHVWQIANYFSLVFAPGSGN